MVPNFSKWPLSFVMVFKSFGIFLTIRVSEGFMWGRPPPGIKCGRGLIRCGMGARVTMVEGGK